MPNWVYNKVQFVGTKERINELKEFVKSEETEFDFNKIIPMPEELNLISGSDETIATACAKARKEGNKTCKEFDNYWTKDKTFNEWADLGDKYLSNFKKYGASTWYDWCCNNWGTKWNACEPVWMSNYVEFNTAWNTPEEIFRKLSELFPDIAFDVEFADEDIGSNCGTIIYDGEHFAVDYINDYEFACGVWGYDPEENEYDESVVE